MAVIFVGKGFVVENGFFSGWKITHAETGETERPARALSDSIGVLWYSLRKALKPTPFARPAAEAVMFEWFALACFYPTSDMAEKFLHMPTDELVELIVMESIQRKI